MTRYVTVDITGTIDLTEQEIFPDGAPDDWDLDDVRSLMETSGGKLNVLRSWNLIEYVEVQISDEDGRETEVWD